MAVTRQGCSKVQGGRRWCDGAHAAGEHWMPLCNQESACPLLDTPPLPCWVRPELVPTPPPSRSCAGAALVDPAPPSNASTPSLLRGGTRRTHPQQRCPALLPPTIPTTGNPTSAFNDCKRANGRREYEPPCAPRYTHPCVRGRPLAHGTRSLLKGHGPHGLRARLLLRHEVQQLQSGRGMGQQGRGKWWACDGALQGGGRLGRA